MRTQGELRKAVLTELLLRKIENVLIGGLAVRVHGGTRLTEDMDLAVRMIDLNQIVEMMYRLGYKLPTSVIDVPDGPQEITWAATAPKAISFIERHRVGACNFYFLHEDGSVLDQTDFVFENPIPFSRLVKSAERIAANPTLLVACVEHLIRMKEERLRRGAGGPNDQQDLEFLQKLLPKGPNSPAVDQAKP